MIGRRWWVVGITLAVLAPATAPREGSAAEDSTPTRRIEEIIVTAQKREQAVEDVPISMSVLDSEFLTEQGLTDVSEALLFVPNAKVDVAGFFASPRVRGFSFNNNNKAFEPPAGLAVDGVLYTRIGYFQSALLDVDRIEVLRGPQGTTFGKNTTAGLISIVTKNPTDEYTGFVDSQIGEFDRHRVEAAVGGPIVRDWVNFRLAGLFDEQDGFIENTTAAIVGHANETFRGRDRKAIRAKLAFPSLLGSDLVVSYDYGDFRDGGSGAELWHISPTVLQVLRRYDPNVDVDKTNFVASMDWPDFRTTKLHTVHADWSYDLAGWGLDLLVAHSIYEEGLSIDTDFTPAYALVGLGSDTSPTTTVELRGLSPSLGALFGLERLLGFGLGTSDLLAGFFFQRRAIDDSEFRFIFNDGPFLELTAAAADSTGLPTPPIPVPPLGVEVLEDVSQFFDQRGNTLAGFAQWQWYFAEHWTLQSGARLSYETKQADWRQVFNTPNQAVLLAAGLREFTAHKELSELQLIPKVSLNWKPTDDLSLFAHWARGFKGGGFNAFAFRDEDDPTAQTRANLDYDPEVVTEWGIDAKTTLLDGAARFNLSLYWMEVEDFQVLTRLPEDSTVGLGVTAVVNAKKARARGLEADLTAFATRWLSVMGTVGLNDTEYLDFRLNECPADMENTDGDADPRCDATGRPFFGAPDWTATFTPTLRVPLADWPGLAKSLPSFVEGVEWMSGFTVEYTDHFYTDVDLDRRKRQASFFRWRASVGFANPRQGWSLRLIGENLTDEATSIRQGDLFAGIFVNAQEPPRQFFGQFRWQF
jgi:outer membrane receptor protein involved in Fe transport